MTSSGILLGEKGPASVAKTSSVISESDLADTQAYFNSSHHSRWKTRTQSVSGNVQDRTKSMMHGDTVKRARRLSHDETPIRPRKFLIDVDSTLRLVLEQEDTDGDFQIAITDAGPKIFSVGTAASNGYKTFDIRGTWMLSVLLQELALAKDHGRKTIILHESRLTENPVDRLSRFIRTSFWDGLTRRIDGDGLEIIVADPKNRSANQAPRIYVPEEEPDMYKYYKQVADSKPHLNLQVEILPKNFDAEYVKSLNDKPGVLALAMQKVKRSDGTIDMKGIPFVVPGARFNELYNWDSYFIALGLLVDGRIELAKGIVEHFVFEIQHYGKILNGSRSYYLMRSQPPFLTDLALQIYSRLPNETEEEIAENKAWLKRAIRAAIKEYHTVWMAEPRLDPVTGLSRYRPDGKGVPPETEPSHFTHLLLPYAEKHGISVNEFVQKYNDGEVQEPELDEYFMHDRGVRESGHDTYRLEKKCANLGTIDLQSLLFKYECDIANAIKEVFDDALTLEEEFELSPFPFGTKVPVESHISDSVSAPDVPNGAGKSSTSHVQTHHEWIARAARRKQLMDHYLWDAGQGMYFDYDTAKKRRSLYESVTCFWAMWCGAASEEQASKMMARALPKFEVAGGLVPGTEASRGRISLDRPNRQWDYPTAWPPHQILAWIAFDRYGYTHDAQRCAYRWLYMLTKSFVDYNGTVAEKFDAVSLSHFVTAEYGNQGLDFAHVPREGFGWTNTSYNLGLTFLTTQLRRNLGALTPPESVFGPLSATIDANLAALSMSSSS